MVELLPLAADELPDVTDAGVGLTLKMVADLLADRERSAIDLQIAVALEAGDLRHAGGLHRRRAAVVPGAARMVDVARAGIERFDAGMGPTGVDPSHNARARRSLVKAVNWLTGEFWPMYGTVRPVMPPAAEPAAPAAQPVARSAAMPPMTRPDPIKSKPCRKAMRDRLQLLDGEIARLAADPRSIAETARLIMVADRNGHAARCRDCGQCRFSADPITRDIPVL